MAKSESKGQRQSTLASFFGAPKKGLPSSQAPASSPLTQSNSNATPRSTTTAARKAATTRPSSTSKPPILHSSSSPASSLRTPPSDPAVSSPLVRRRQPRIVTVDSDDDQDDLSPPPLDIVPKKANVKAAPPKDMPPVTPTPPRNDEAMDVDESPFLPTRRAKRKAVVYAESDSDSGSDVPVTNARKPRKSLRVDDDDDDDFVFDEAEDAALAAAADEYEATMASEAPSPSPSITSIHSPIKKSGKKSFKDKPFVAPKATAKKSTTSWLDGAASSSTSRPPSKPISRESSSGKNDSSNFLLTAAERKKLQAKEEKRENEQCFDFLIDIKDKDGNRPDDPDYDPRTIFIPRSSWATFTPFEKQFWEIKQNHYDTVLFFQKGKFYELYENDAMIGHQEFDLKLTDRVKMKMVGVPEQSFEFWAAKFLGAGYKVGKVEQAETAIGMEMRTKAAKSGGKEIVRRELAQVFTNGTIVDGTYLTTDEANHCVAVKEWSDGPNANSSFGICVMDASTGEFNLSAFDDDICRTRLETMFRQIRPKELVFAKGNLSVSTTRLLRNILPPSTLWQSFKPEKEFLSVDETLSSLESIFGSEELPEAISGMLDKPLAVEALGGMLFYLRSLNLDKDLISQKNFNIYDPIKQGKNLVLDGQTLGHMEVLVNSEGGAEGTLLHLLQRCLTPFGKRLFRIWLTSPLKDARAINERLDAVEDLMNAPHFSGQFSQLCKNLPDLERLISRIHAGSVKQNDFLKVVNNFTRIQETIERLTEVSEEFASASVRGLLRAAPDLQANLKHIRSMYNIEQDEKTIAILPNPGADEECDNADAEIARVEDELDQLLRQAKKATGAKDISYWHSAQGNKEIYQIQVPASTKVPRDWTKCGGTKANSRYYTPDTLPVIREMQEARETQSIAKKNFFLRLLAEFDKDRLVWLKMIRVVAELDCLVSLAKASYDMDEPKCRPEFVDSEQAFIDFAELRHPSMCLQRDFIPNDVQLGKDVARTTLLTGPNMAGKSTLLRMTAAGVIMAQIGCYVPAAHAKLSPIDKIQTRMGAYDNMFASASTFKVELDECSKILREAGPRSFVILDELGRGTSTFDGMAIAGAVLHHLSTHTLPLGFFATHYGSLTDDFQYHPNIRNMHMQVHVDDNQGVVFLYKLITGHAESSHGTHVAKLAGVPQNVIDRADEVSAQFFAAFQEKLTSRRQSTLPLTVQADFAWLLRVASGKAEETTATISEQLDIVRRAAAVFGVSA